VNRRQFITLLGGGAAWPVTARAQQSAMPVFGILLVFSRESGRTFTEPLRAYMQALGYVEGRNVAFDSAMPTAKRTVCRRLRQNSLRSGRP
jgi:putative ABC transport system substrate-binding protein